MARANNKGGMEGGGGSGRWTHKFLIAAILLFFIAVPTASQTVQKVPVSQYFVSVMEALNVSVQLIAPEKFDSSVCVSYGDNLQNCTQSGNTSPLLLDGQRTEIAANCTNWPETANYYTWNKAQQPRIILVIPQGWCADYVTIAYCKNTKGRIYEPLSVNISVYNNSISEEPQPLHSNYMRLASEHELPRINLDCCRMERYLEIQVLDPPGFRSTEIYHFISEVEVFGHQLQDALTNTDGSSTFTAVISLVFTVSVLLVMGIAAAVVVSVVVVRKTRRVQDGQGDYEEPDTENMHTETQVHHQNSTPNLHVSMTTNPAYNCIRVASPPEPHPLIGTHSSCNTSAGVTKREPQDHENPVPTSRSGQWEGSGYGFVLEDKAKRGAPHPHNGPAHFRDGDSGNDHTTSESQEHKYDYVGEVPPRTHGYTFVLCGTQHGCEVVPGQVDAVTPSVLSHQQDRVTAATETTSDHIYI